MYMDLKFSQSLDIRVLKGSQFFIFLDVLREKKIGSVPWSSMFSFSHSSSIWLTWPSSVWNLSFNSRVDYLFDFLISFLLGSISNWGYSNKPKLSVRNLAASCFQFCFSLLQVSHPVCWLLPIWRLFLCW